jgi:hypothetical protein
MNFSKPLAVAALSLAMLAPAHAGSKEQRQSSCLLAQAGLALHSYTHDNGIRIPAAYQPKHINAGYFAEYALRYAENRCKAERNDFVQNMADGMAAKIFEDDAKTLGR